jgi:glucose/mannose transport system substrate-binding protein
MNFKTNVATRALLLGALAITAQACGGSEPTDKNAQPSGKVDIFSWWTSGGEVQALNALIDVHEKKYPQTNVENLAEALAEEARTRLEQRMQDGVPPDLFQANIGADQFKWVLFNGVDDSESKVESLNDIAQANGWMDTFPQAVIDALSYNGKIYGVPANIHRINSLFYSIDAFAAAGIEPPTTREELITAAQALQAANYTPICIGSEHWWTLNLLMFENIMPSVGGPDFYTSYWTGQEDPNAAQVSDGLDFLLELWPYMNQDANALGWTAGIDHMFDATAPCAMTVMGDWAKGYLESKGWVAGTNFEQIPFPGSNGTFVFTADTFPLPKGAPNRPGAVAFLETIGSVDGQVAFNKLKGSIPVRRDIDPTLFDATAQQTMDDFANNTLVKALSGLQPQGSFADLGPQVKEMLSTQNKEGVLNVLANDYGVLQ